ncbi:MAG: hypothetical protein ACI4VL_01070 [Bacilli bacterium]
MTYKNRYNTFLTIYHSLILIDIFIIALSTNYLIKLYKKIYDKIIEDLLSYAKIVNEQFLKLKYREKYFDSVMSKIIYIPSPTFDSNV